MRQLATLLTAVACAVLAFSREGQAPSTNNAVAIAVSRSLNGRLHPVPISAVKLTDGFWSMRARLLTERTLPLMRQQLDEHGTIDNFLRAAGKKNVPRRGRPSSDSDLYKWIEAAAWAIASPGTAPATKQKFQADTDGLIPIIAGAQDPAGYLDTNFTGDRAHLRFTDLVHSHEDYCLARLLFAGVAYFRATQNRALLAIGIKAADNLIATFGPDSKPFVAAHPELASALVELYRTLGDAKYLVFARYLLGANERERLHLKDAEAFYMVSGKPFPARTELEGQAVNALYAAAAATDYFAESGDPAYKKAVDLLWTDLTQHRMSVTGGVGLRPGTDLVGDAYDVMLGSFVSQTPVAIANIAWNLRMLTVTADSRYADVFERALYNAGSASFTQNGSFTCGRTGAPASSDKPKFLYFETDTCPPDLPAQSLAIGSYAYATSPDGIYVNLFNDSELDWRLEDGTGLRVLDATNYPFDGDIKLTISPAKASQFVLHLRWPAWAGSVELTVNGEKASTGDAQPGTFIALNRQWQPGDTVGLTLPLQPNVMRANPRAVELWGRAAIERGPIVYALEQADQPGVPVSDCFLRLGSPGTSEFHKELFGGTTLVKFPGSIAEKSLALLPLYSLWKENPLTRRAATLVFAPYHLLGSREVDAAETWVPVVRSPDAPAPVTAGKGDSSR